jgi:hypothetical protein
MSRLTQRFKTNKQAARRKVHQRLRRQPEVEKLESRITPSTSLVQDIFPGPFGSLPPHGCAHGSRTQYQPQLFLRNSTQKPKMRRLFFGGSLGAAKSRAHSFAKGGCMPTAYPYFRVSVAYSVESRRASMEAPRLPRNETQSNLRSDVFPGRPRLPFASAQLILDQFSSSASGIEPDLYVGHSPLRLR